MTYQLPAKREFLICPFCRKVVPWDDRCFIEHEYVDEDGEPNWDWDTCCEECFNKYA